MPLPDEHDDDAGDDAPGLVTITAMSYIHVAEDETEQTIELPCEEDETLSLSTLTSHFPDASGLKFRNPDSGGFRGIRLKGNGLESRLQPPEKGWSQSSVYFVVKPKNKRKNEDAEPHRAKRPEPGRQKCSDLIVLGLPWKTTENDLKEYFEQFGAVVMAQVKKDPKSGLSKGFGFVRFESFDSQHRVIARRHNISGRWCDVRIPLSRGESYQSAEFSRKIFVGRLSEEVAVDDLREYFSQFGEVADVFIPKPFRAFAFVTFSDSEVAQSLCGDDHILRAAATGATVSVHVSSAVPKHDVSVSGFGGVNGTSAGRATSLTNHSSVQHAPVARHRVHPYHLSEARSFAAPLPQVYSFTQPHFAPNAAQNQLWNSAARDGLNPLSAATASAGVQNAFPVNGLTLNPQAALQLAAALVASPPNMALFSQKPQGQSASGAADGLSQGQSWPGGEEGGADGNVPAAQ